MNNQIFLNAMRYCCSYTEVRNYEMSAAFQVDIEIIAGAFIQFVWDNADWNIETIDGKGTFHSLGGCQIITPSSNVKPRNPFARKTDLTEKELSNNGKVA